MLPKPNFHAFFISKPETAQETSAPRRRSSACHWPSPAPTWEQFRLESVDETSTPATPISLGLMVPQPRASRIGVVASLPDMTFISDWIRSVYTSSLHYEEHTDITLEGFKTYNQIKWDKSLVKNSGVKMIFVHQSQLFPMDSVTTVIKMCCHCCSPGLWLLSTSRYQKFAAC